jgi:hypothetical protein
MDNKETHVMVPLTLWMQIYGVIIALQKLPLHRNDAESLRNLAEIMLDIHKAKGE